MRIIFVLDYFFPSSNAPSNRIEALCKGFLYGNHLIDVISLRGSWQNEDNLTTDERINIHYAGGKSRAENFLKRNFLKLFGMVKSFFLIFNENRKNKIEAVFVPVNKNALGIFYFILFKILNIKMLQERSEYPEIYKRTITEKIGYYFYIKCFTKLLDGMIVMTDNLKLYYNKIMTSKSLVKTIPMSVDIERFSTNCIKQSEDYIAYCGDLSNNKDGVDILINAFCKISNKFPSWQLYLIGGSSELHLKKLSDLCTRLKIEDKVIFTGRISSKDMPSYLNKSKILALARPSSLQSHGGFPTKLGEYLATKNPVIVTNVGEITSYLIDNKSAYIAIPDSIDNFAMKLEECIENYDKSIQIGINGHMVAKENFDYKSQSKLLDDFILNLIKE